MKILNFGSLNIDNVYTVDHFIRPGETMSTEGMEIYCGGKGLNQSIALARAGASVWHAGAIGASDGNCLLETLKDAGVETELIRHTKGVSGHTIIQVDRSGQNCILLYGGANQEITKQQADETLSRFEEGDILLLQNEINELPYIIQKASEKHMKIYLNPSPADKALFSMPLDKISCFILNEIEASDIITEFSCGKSKNQELEAEQLIERLHEIYPKAAILLTLGSKGSIYFDGEKQYKQPAVRVAAVDTTGAGDTFTGYFIASLSQGLTVEKALERASKAAAIAVTRNGASISIPGSEEVDSYGETEKAMV